MLVQEKVYMEGDHIARRINELGLKQSEWKFLPWNPMFALIFYDVKPNMVYDKEQQKWMKIEPPDTEKSMK